MEKDLQRMEAAEDPQKIGADIRGLPAGEDTFQFAVKKTVPHVINRSLIKMTLFMTFKKKIKNGRVCFITHEKARGERNLPCELCVLREKIWNERWKQRINKWDGHSEQVPYSSGLWPTLPLNLKRKDESSWNYISGMQVVF